MVEIQPQNMPKNNRTTTFRYYTCCFTVYVLLLLRRKEGTTAKYMYGLRGDQRNSNNNDFVCR